MEPRVAPEDIISFNELPLLFNKGDSQEEGVYPNDATDVIPVTHGPNTVKQKDYGMPLSQIGVSTVATCDSAENSRDKTAIVITKSFPFKIENNDEAIGRDILVKFENGNTADSPRLKIGGLNSCPIICIGGTAEVGTGCWDAGATMKFTFDGNNWLMHSNIAKKTSEYTITSDGTIFYNKEAVESIENSINENISSINGDIDSINESVNKKINIDGSNGTAAGVSTLINKLTTSESTPVDNDYYISQYVNGGTATTSFHRRPMKALWEYIKGKISSILGLTATNYGGNSAGLSNSNITIQTGSIKIAKITLQTLMNWLITNKHIPANTNCTKVIQTSWVYANNDILQLNANGINYELQLAGVVIEFMGTASDYNTGMFRLRIHSSPTVSFTVSSGYTVFPVSHTVEYTCNGSGYSPTWKIIADTTDTPPVIKTESVNATKTITPSNPFTLYTVTGNVTLTLSKSVGKLVLVSGVGTLKYTDGTGAAQSQTLREGEITLLFCTAKGYSTEIANAIWN